MNNTHTHHIEKHMSPRSRGGFRLLQTLLRMGFCVALLFAGSLYFATEAYAAQAVYTISDGSLTAATVSGACDTSLTNATPTDGGQGTVVGSTCVGRSDSPVVKWTKTLTWQTMGIPAGSTITSVDGSFKYRVVQESHTATQAMGTMQLQNSGDTAACAASTLEASFDPGAVNASYTTRDSASGVNVNSECSSSATSVTVRLNMSPVTGNNGSATSELRADDIQLTITYTPATLTLSGTLYSDEGVTQITSGKTVKLAVGTSTPATVYSTTTDTGAGTFTFSVGGTGIATGTPFVVWVEDGATPAAFVTKASTTKVTQSITGVPLYKYRVIISHVATTSTSTTIADMAIQDNDNSAYIPFNASSTAGTLTVFASSSLYIASGKTFAPGGIVTILGNASTSAQDGTLQMTASSTFTQSGTTTLAGSFLASSSATFTHNSYPLLFNATTTGKNIVGGTLAGTLGDVIFNGSGGGWAFVDSASTSDFTITAGTVTMPSGALTIMGDYTNYGTSTHNAGTVYVAAGTTTISGNATGTSSLGNIRTDPRTTSSWTARSAAGDNDDWQAVTYGNGVFVAVSDSLSGQRVITSSDGTSWATPSAAGDNDFWRDVTYGNGLFVAVGGDESDGRDHVMTSSDGTSWTARSAAGNDDYWLGVTYGNGLFVAVAGGSLDKVMTSSDGTSWTVQSAAGNDDYWQDVTYGNGLFVAVGMSAGDRVMTSPDGINWTARSAAGDNDDWRGVTYANGLFVAVGDSGDRLMTSPDGINWTVRSAAGNDDYWRDVTYGNGLFVAVGWNSNIYAHVMTSFDGTSWTVHSAAGDNDYWQGVTYGNGLFVAVGDTTGDRVMTSQQSGALVFSTTRASTTDLFINSNTTLTAPAELSISGNYTNSGTFTAGSGTTTFNGTSQQTATGTMVGTSTFANLVITNTSGAGSTSQSVIFGARASTTDTFTMVASTSAQFLAGATSTFQHIDLQGAAGSYVWLRSSSGGSWWGLAVPGTQKNVLYVNVRDSSACAGYTDITVIDGYDAGGNSCWTFAAGTTILDLSGALYSDEGVTQITSGKTIVLAVGTSTIGLFSTTTDTGAGTFSFSATGTDVAAGIPYVIFVDDTTTQAAIFSKFDDPSVAVTNIPLYQNRAIVSHDATSGTSTTIADMAFYDYTDDTSIPYEASSTAETLTVLASSSLYIASGKTFAPGGAVTILGNASTSAQDGTLQMKANSAFTLGGDVTLAGSLLASSSATLSQGFYPLTFNATTTGKSVAWATTTGSFGTLIFEGVGGSWSFGTTNATATDITIATGTLTAPSGTLALSGSFAQGGTFSHNSGSMKMFGATTSAKVGGDSVNSSWGASSEYEIMVLLAHDDALYVGLGNLFSHGDVWRYNGSSWTKIGGDSINSGWTTNYDEVSSMVAHNDTLYVGLGNDAGEAEVWEYNGSSWTQVGGDGVASSWNTNYEYVKSLASHNGKLYAGLGSGTGDAEVWEYNGSSWTQVGGDGVASSWNTNYEYAQSLASHNGKLYAGLGTGDGDGEVWEYNGSSWTQIGGDLLNSSWIDGGVRLLSWDNALYAGLVGTTSVWKYNGSSWTQLGDSGLNEFAAYGNGILDLKVHEGILYAAIAGTETSVWGYMDGAWSRIFGAETGISSASETYSTARIASYKGSLYGGLGNDSTDSDLWRIGDVLAGGLVGTDALNDVSVSGVASFVSAASTSDLTIQSGATTSAPVEILSIAGDYVNNGKFIHSTGTILFASSSAQSLSGFMTGSSTFYDLAFTGAGTKTFAANASATDMTIGVGATVEAPSQLTLAGAFQNEGTVTHGDNVAYLAQGYLGDIVGGQGIRFTSGGGGSPQAFFFVSDTILYVGRSQSGVNCSTTLGSTDSCELWVADVSTPGNMTYITARDSDGATNGNDDNNIYAFARSGSTLYVGKDLDTGGCSEVAGSADGCELIWFDISSTTNPVFQGGRDSSGNTASTLGPSIYDMVVSGSVLYVAKSQDTTACTQTAGSADGCELIVFDISSTTNPVFVAGRDSSGSADGTLGSTLNSLTLSGTTLYAAGYGSSTACVETAGSASGCELIVFDVSSSTNPIFVAGRDSSGDNTGIEDDGGNLDGAEDIEVYGSNLFLVKSGSSTACTQTAGSASGCEFQIYDISSSTNPVFVAGRDTSGSATGAVDADMNAIVIRDNRAYIGKDGKPNTSCSGTTGSAQGCMLDVYDISSTTNPVHKTSRYKDGLRHGENIVTAPSMETLAIDPTGELLYVTASGWNSDYEAPPCTILDIGAFSGCNIGVYDLTPDLSGNMTGTSVFGDVSVLGAAVFADNASTSDLSIQSGGVLMASSTELSVSGNYTNSGFFSQAVGTTTFNGTSQQTATGTLSGISAFNNLVITNTSQNGSTTSSVVFGAKASSTGTFTMAASSSAAFLAGATSTFQNISFAGAAGSPVYLRSTVSDTQWGIEVPGTRSLSYVNVKDANACSGYDDIVAGNTSFDIANNDCWTFFVGVVLSGTLYSDEGVTPITGGETIVAAIGTSTVSLYSATSDGALGTWSISVPDDTYTIATGTPFVIFVDGDANIPAATISKFYDPTVDVSSIPLYQRRVIVSHEASSATSTTIADMATYDGSDDSDIPYTAATSTAALVVRSGNELYVRANKVFAPGGYVIVHGNASASALDGSLRLQDSATYTAGGLTTLAGSFRASSTATYTPHREGLLFNATTTGKTVTSNVSRLGVVTFEGSGGAWSFDGASATTSALALISGTLTAPSGNLVSFGTFANNGTFTDGGGTFTLAGTSTSALVGGDGVNSSWADATYEYVNSMVSHNGKLYAGLGSGASEDEVWEYDGSTWTKIGGDSTNSSWSGFTYVRSLASYNGKLYAGLCCTTGAAEVWEYNGSSWTKVGGDAVNSSWANFAYEVVQTLAAHNGKLYAGLGLNTNESEVWEYDGSAWVQVGGDGTASSWNTNYEYVDSLVSHNGKLYAGLGSGSGDGEVWEYDGSSWVQIGGDSVNSGWTTGYDEVLGLASHNGKLYAGLCCTAGEAEVWAYNGSSWTKVGGDGINASWADSTYEIVRGLASHEGLLYAGLGNTQGEAELWVYHGASWTKVGGDGVYDTWTDSTYEVVQAPTSHNGSLFVGLSTGQGDAEVWRVGEYVLGTTTGSSPLGDVVASSSLYFTRAASTTDFTILSGTTSAPIRDGLSIAGNYSNSGVFTHGTGTVYFSGSSPQTLTGTMTGSSAFATTTLLGAGTKSFSSNASTTHLTIATSSGSVSAPTLLSIAGNYSNGSTLSQSSGTTTFSGSSASLSGGGTNTFGNMHVTGSYTSTFAQATTTNLVIDSGASVGMPSALMTISGNYTNSGTLTAGSGTTTFTGSSKALSGTLNDSSALNHVVISGSYTAGSNASTSNLVIDTGGSFTAPTLLSISGHYTNSGTLTAGSGTTTFSGSSQQVATGTMTGTSAFTNLAIANTSADGVTTQSVLFGARASSTGLFTMAASSSAAFPASATSSFAGVNWTGASGSSVYLRSSQSGTKWGLEVPSTPRTLAYVNVKDSNACSGYDAMDATDGTHSNAGNNSCWTFPAAATGTISSTDNQTFAAGDDVTGISTITITDSGIAPTITTTNDIRIAIATSSIGMLWYTGDTTATFGGTASGKVSNPVSYEGGGSVLVIPVSTNFSAGDTLTISDLAFTSFTSVNTATNGLLFYADGAGDAEADDIDDKTIAITGALTVSEHSAGQVDDNFSATASTDVPIFGFRLAPAGEYATTTAVTVTLSGIDGVAAEDLTNAELYRDKNSDGDADPTDTAVGGSGAVSVSGQTGTIIFSSEFLATTTQDYILIIDTNNIKPGDAMTVSLTASNITATGVTLGAPITPSGSVTRVQHIRSGAGSGSSQGPIGGDTPAGGGVQGGGGAGGGGGVDPDSGDSIGNEPGFEAPSATGSSYNQWTDGANGYSSDGAYATAASGGLLQSYSTFDFGIPSNNTINGIEVKVEASASTAAGTIDVALSWNGDSNVTSAQSTATLSATDAVYSLGGPADTWGRSWSVDDFSNANFRVRVTAQPSGNTVRIDALQVKVHHIATGGGGGGGGGIVRAPTRGGLIAGASDVNLANILAGMKEILQRMQLLVGGLLLPLTLLTAGAALRGAGVIRYLHNSSHVHCRMAIKVAINGLGRIGRTFVRLTEGNPDIELVAANDLGNKENLAYLLKYDTAYGRNTLSVETTEDGIKVGEKTIRFLSERDPAKLPWKELGVDVVVESTGVFETYEKAKAHLDAGAKHVVISAPASGDPAAAGVKGGTALIGVNDSLIASCDISSNASCTTNAASPLIAILHEGVGVERAILNTVHAYTATQSIQDGPGGKDYRRGRAAAQNIVPNSTGAARAVTEAYPALKGKFDGIALRVPVIVGSIVDITFVATRPTTAQEVNDIMRRAAASPAWQGVFAVTEEQLVSSDIIGATHASIADLSFTRVVDGTLVKVLGWYDNETSYTATLIQHVIKAGRKGV